MNSESNSTTPLDRKHRLREAALLSFCDPVAENCLVLAGASDKEWRSLLQWLDTSGLALYFLDRLKELDLCDLAPLFVITRLEQNLVHNTKRINELVHESITIQQGFHTAQLSYGLLKGFSLWPLSVPNLKLRSQLDLDFLIAESSATHAQEVLEQMGYRLRAVSGRTLEFKAEEHRVGSLKDLYTAGFARSVELHVESGELSALGGESLLSRTVCMSFQDVLMPVLSPLDIFIGQGLHVYKHVCSEFARTAHLLEFRRHVTARYEDLTFWDQLRQQISSLPEIRKRLGVVTLLISRVMGSFAPENFTGLVYQGLPESVAHWVNLYGSRSVLTSFPGSKLYLLLERELEDAGLQPKRSLRQALLPSRLPQTISLGVSGETWQRKFKRHHRQLMFIAFRLRFHTVEGLRFIYESFRWRHYRNGMA